MTSRQKKQPESTAPALTRDGVPLARVRHAPRPVPFLVTGGLIGMIAAFIISIRTENGSYDPSSASWYLMAFFGMIGVLLGGALFAILDKRSERS